MKGPIQPLNGARIRPCTCGGPSPLLQLGLRGGVRDEYISGRHTVCIEDITPFVREMGAIAAGGEPRWVGLLVPSERVLRLRDEVRSHIAADAHPVH